MKKNPIAISVQALAGTQLPANWKPSKIGGAYDQRRMEDLWKSPQWSSKLNADNVDNIMRSSRLSGN